MILDPSPARADLPDELFPLIDIMKPNEKELSILTGMPTETDEEIKAAADALLEKRCFQGCGYPWGKRRHAGRWQ